MSIAGFALNRLVQMLPTLAIVTVAVFVIVRVLPGDAVTAMLDGKASDAVAARMREQMGLSRPLMVQFGLFLQQIATGDLGQSISLKVPVTEAIFSRLPVTLFLTVFSILLAVVIALPAAFISALRRGTAADLAVRGGLQIFLSMPVFYIGLLLLSVFAARLKWLPVGGYGETFPDQLYHLFLPSLTIALYTAAILMRNLRAALIEVLGAEFVRFARAKGLSRRVILTRHVLRNALISTVTLIGLSIGNLLSGTLVTETVFGVPGVGRLMLDAIYARDYPIIQGATLIFAVAVSIVFFATDLLQAMLDPRLKR